MKVSVIIPTYNRPEALEDCLKALREQKFEGGWEVIVVDDGGLQDLNKLIKGFKQELNVILIKQENKGPAAARNNGARHAKGEYIAFLDDDCEPEKDWLNILTSRASTGVMIGGKTINKFQSNLYSETSQALVTFLYQYFENTPWYFFTSNNFLVHRETFLEVGGFDQNFRTSAGEDREFCLRWLHYGYKMSYCERAVILHAHCQSLRSFWKMHLKYGSAAVSYVKKTRELGVGSLKTSPKFYISLLSFLWNRKDKKLLEKVSISGPLIISQVATLLGYLKVRLLHSNQS
ncbi:MAG: glycosyltransferase family 2 protein [Roseivirga sp.]|uniref:glycosyltransferase family 2 protein n=1 Tax=Roseivirga sp. TaxID=1964215 RepID=UPI001B2353CC|nr:glycosyltransferase family A protein [Roseivirga sp.]MBO6496688.1 glycosyltransferase family 2 protein [Roseivirga sp.]